LFRTFDKYQKCCLEEPKLCPLKLLYKIHKPGTSVRPKIGDATYYTSQTSTFLHCHHGQKVLQNPIFLKDSLTLVRQLKEVQVSASHNIRFATFDVTALYPSIDLERGLKSLKWFFEPFCFEFEPAVTELMILVLARFILTLLHFLPRSQRQSVLTIGRHCYGHVFCSGLCQYPLNIRGDKHNLQLQ
jgi:hypothetical protein